ncbi:MAG: hypothetical protein ABI646_01175 [Acidobacteriota bacterium]
MSNKTIAKILGLVILVLGWCASVSSCSNDPSTGGHEVNASELSPDFEKPIVVGRIESPDVTESSGIAASLCQPKVFWTHNDSGDDAFIFALSENGKNLGTYRVSNARNSDWEDIASYKSPDGTCYLYIGDIGNNKLERPELRVYRVKEPTVADAGDKSDRKNPRPTNPADVTVFKYQDTPHNAETLMVQPQTGDVYVLTKRLEGPSLVFKFRPQFGTEQPVIAEKVGEVSVPAVPNGLLTSGAISPDAKRVILCDYTAGYELNASGGGSFDEIWKSKPLRVDLGDRKHGEAVTFSDDGKAIVGTSEGKKAEIFEVKIK